MACSKRRETEMGWLRYDVFVSYSRRDSAVVVPFVDALRDAGYKVFYDKESLIVGDRWKERLSAAIASCRVCVLCWSENAKSSEIVAYEYSRAEGLKKPVLPWLLDGTPLPKMVEIQGVSERDPVKAVSRIRPRLSWSLTLRRRLQAAVLILLVIAVVPGYRMMHRPLPPWQFSGRVIDSETRLPIAGVLVEVQGNQFETHTDSDGRYEFHLPPPRPTYLKLVFAKEGYRGEAPVNVLSDHPFDTDMTRLDAKQR